MSRTVSSNDYNIQSIIPENKKNITTQWLVLIVYYIKEHRNGINMYSRVIIWISEYDLTIEMAYLIISIN